jgi:hypothetical protein
MFNRDSREKIVGSRASLVATTTTLALITSLFWLRILRAVPLDVDAHHDGIVLSTAVALKDGRIPYRDYFLMYGVLSDIVNVIGMQLLGWLSPVLALRTTSLFLLTVSSLLLLRRKTDRRNVTLVLSACTVIFALNDISYGVTFLPWSNLLLNLLLAMLIRLALADEKEIENAPRRYWFSWIVISILICLVKPQFLAIILLLPLLSPRAGLARQFARHIFALSVIGVVSLAGFSAVAPSIATSLWAFTVELPRSDYWTASLNYFSAFLVQMLRRDLFLVTACFLAGLTLNLNLPLSAARRNVRLVVGALLPISLACSLNRSELSWVASQIDFASRSPRILELLWLALLGSVIGILAAQLIVAVQMRGRVCFRRRRDIVLAAIGFAGLTQYAPVPDTRHAWYAVVPAILCVCAILMVRSLRTRSINVITAFAATLGLFLYVDTRSDWHTYLGLHRTPAASALLAGTSSRSQDTVTALYEQRVLNTDMDLLLLESELRDSQNAVFVVDDALFSVFDGTWRSVDKWQVQWDLTEPFETRLAQQNSLPVVIQTSKMTFNLMAIQETLRQKGYVRMVQGNRIAIFRQELNPQE